MSTNNKYVKDIVTPSLNDVSYADSIKECFNNVNQNFKILANHDFIKGNTGDSITTKKINLKTDPEKDYWIEQIKTAIKRDLTTQGDEAEYKSITFDDGPVSPFDKITDSDLYLIYSNEYNNENLEIKESKIISSLNFVFLDARFNRDLSKLSMNAVGNPNPDNAELINDISNAKDLSCIVTWNPDFGENGGLVAMQSFPVLYYDELLGFCWKINGKLSGIPAQGPRGADGTVGRIFLVKIDKKAVTEGNWYKVVKILNDAGDFVDPYDASVDKNLIKYYDQLDGAIALALPENSQSASADPDFWVSIIDRKSMSDGNTYFYANCTDDNSIKIEVAAKEILDVFKHIDWKGVETVKGLFIPKNPNAFNGQAHTIYADNKIGSDYKDLNIGLADVNNGTPITDPDSNLNINYDNVNIKGNLNSTGSLTASGNIKLSDTVINGNIIIHGENNTNIINSNDLKLESNSSTAIKSPIINIEGSNADSPAQLNIKSNLIHTGDVKIEGKVSEGTSTAFGEDSHAEGTETNAIGINSHAEGGYTYANGAGSHAEGSETESMGNYSHAEGELSKANNVCAHAEGHSTEAAGENSHAEGEETIASGIASHAEGFGSKIEYVETVKQVTTSDPEYSGTQSINNGFKLINSEVIYIKGSIISIENNYYKIINTNKNYIELDKPHELFATESQKNIRIFQIFGVSTGEYSHAEGIKNIASGNASHAEGKEGIALGNASHTEGIKNIASGIGSHAEGEFTTSSGDNSHSEGCNTKASGKYSHAEGNETGAFEESSHSEGCNTKASGKYSHVEGYDGDVSGNASHAEGVKTTASGSGAHAEGGWGSFEPGHAVFEARGGTASGDASHAEGVYTESTGLASHAEGEETIASGIASHAEGQMTIATGHGAHAEGGWATKSISPMSNNISPMSASSKATNNGTKAFGDFSHAEGQSTTASGLGSHSEGYITKALGNYSHAEGNETEAIGFASHAGGKGTVASSDYQTVIGKNNKTWGGNISGDFSFIIGGGEGSDDINRKNIFTVDWSGNVRYSGTISSGTGADYAEYFEWLDGNLKNEDRVGYFVSLNGNKLVKAKSNSSYILGIISANPSILGDNPMEWRKKYLTDEWGRPVYEEVEVENENGEKVKERRQKLNPAYNKKFEYKSREERPEWSPVGMLGKLLVRQDGSLKAGCFCKSNDNGIATKSDSGYYVLEIINKKIARIIFK